MGMYDALLNKWINTTGLKLVSIPSLAANVTLTGGKSWAYGAWGQIDTAAHLTAATYLVGIDLSAFSAADQVQVDLGTGAAAAEVSLNCAVRGTRWDVGVAASAVGSLYRSLDSLPYIAATTRIAGRAANNGAGATTVDVVVTGLQGL